MIYRHKYTLFLSIDGNFKQQLKIKNCDPEDIELFVASKAVGLKGT